MSSSKSSGLERDRLVQERRRKWRRQHMESQEPRSSSQMEVSSPAKRFGQGVLHIPNHWWRSTFSQFSREKSVHSEQRNSPGGSSTKAGSGLVMGKNSCRRQSFLYRQDIPTARVRCKSNIETPAINFSVSEKLQSSSPYQSITDFAEPSKAGEDELYTELAKTSLESTGKDGGNSLLGQMALKETIKEFDWCLDVLENLQCKRSVSSLTRAKFCSILSQELSSSFSLTDTPVDLTSEEAMEADTDNSDVPVLTDPPKTQHNRPYLSKRLITHQTTQSGRSSSQISDYIYLTFIEEDDDDEVVSFSDSHESRQLLSSKFSLRTRKGNRTELGESENGLPDENGDVTRKKVLGLRSGTNEKSRTCVDRYLMELWESNAEFDPKRVEQFIHCQEETWAPDLFELNRVSNQHPLSSFGLVVFYERGILESMSVPVVKMFRFLQRAESLYSQKNSFHNAVHATDVLHTTDVILTFNNVEALFSDLEIFATLFACVIHDIDHPGVSNQYLINANSELAILYNDNSVLENHHLSFAFELLAREPQCDVTSELTTEQRKFFRKMVINLVLSTDMSKHMSLLADLKTMVETQRASGSNIISLDNYSSRIQILQSLIHAADLSNPTKPLRIYRQWVDRITQEMFRQGDLEREAGLEISPMCDRKNAQVNENQVSFIDYIIYPLWETLGELLSPDSKIIMHNITQNREWYAKPKNEQGQEEN